MSIKSLTRLFAVFGAFLLWAPTVSAGMDARPLSIVGGTIIDGRGGPPLENAVVNVMSGRIQSVGPRSTVRPIEGAQILDASGKWVLPGLIDAHMHFSQSGGLYTRPDVIDLRQVRPFAQEQAWIRQRLPFTLSRYICSGVTSVADFGGPMWTIDLARSSGSSLANDAAPTVWAAGPLLSNYSPPELDGSDPAILKLANPQAARSAVRHMAAAGADYIKLWMLDTDNFSATMPSFRAAIDEAHARGLRVLAHATELWIAKLAVTAGIDVLAHAVSDQLVDDEFLTLLKSRDIITVSTLAVIEGYDRVLSRTASVTGFMRRCGDPQVIATWSQIPADLVGRPSPPDPIPARNVKRLVDAGLKVAAGSDAGNIGTLHGPGLHRELELLVKAGLTPNQALVAATSNAARVLAPSPDVGVIASGKKADLLILGKNPLDDVRSTQDIQHVIYAGRLVDRE